MNYLTDDALIEARKVLESSIPGDSVVVSWESLNELFDRSTENTKETQNLEYVNEELEKEIDNLHQEIYDLEAELAEIYDREAESDE